MRTVLEAYKRNFVVTTTISNNYLHGVFLLRNAIEIYPKVIDWDTGRNRNNNISPIRIQPCVP